MAISNIFKYHYGVRKNAINIFIDTFIIFLCTILRWCQQLTINISRKLSTKKIILVVFVSAFKVSIPSYVIILKVLILIFYICRLKIIKNKSYIL